MKKILKSLKDTSFIAKNLSKLIKKDSIILLDGNLGAGKTFFTAALAYELGVKNIVSSPSYSYIKEYFFGDFLFYHMDFYRLKSIEEAYLLDIEIYLNAKAICVIEWFQIIRSFIPFSSKEIIKVKLIQMKNEDRILFIYSNNKDLNRLFEEVLK